MRPVFCREYKANKTCSYGKRCRYIHATATDILDPPKWIFTSYPNLPLIEYSPEEMHLYYKQMEFSNELDKFRTGYDSLWMTNYNILYNELNRLNDEDRVCSSEERMVDLRENPEIFIRPFDASKIYGDISEIRAKEKEIYDNESSIKKINDNVFIDGKNVVPYTKGSNNNWEDRRKPVNANYYENKNNQNNYRDRRNENLFDVNKQISYQRKNIDFNYDRTGTMSRNNNSDSYENRENHNYIERIGEKHIKDNRYVTFSDRDRNYTNRKWEGQSNLNNSVSSERNNNFIDRRGEKYIDRNISTSYETKFDGNDRKNDNNKYNGYESRRDNNNEYKNNYNDRYGSYKSFDKRNENYFNSNNYSTDKRNEYSTGFNPRKNEYRNRNNEDRTSYNQREINQPVIIEKRNLVNVYRGKDDSTVKNNDISMNKEKDVQTLDDIYKNSDFGKNNKNDQ